MIFYKTHHTLLIMRLFHDWRDIFPYDPRSGQIEMMDFVRDTLLKRRHVAIEAQNGWGKTITALSAALSANFERVIICTRTHEQVNHIVDEVKEINSNTDLNIRCTVLGARYRFCINPWCEGGTNIPCSDFMERDGNLYYCVYDRMNDDPMELLVPTKMPRSVEVPRNLDIEAAKETGFYERVCPYHLAKVAAGVSDVIVTPYNFVFSIPQRASFNLDIADSVIVVDEAHNLPSACRNLNTATVTVDEIRDFISRVRGVAEKGMLLQMVKFRNWVRGFPDNMSDELRSKIEKGFVYGNDVLQEMSKFGITRKGMLSVLQLFDEISSSSDIYSFISLLFLTNSNKGILYRSIGGISYTLLDVSDAVADVCQHNSRLLFMSGTLSPISAFEKEVGLDLEYRAFGNVLPRNRFQVELLGSVGDDVSLSTKFENRYDEDTIMWYGNVVSQLVEFVPNGSIIMFPSYSLKESMMTNWEINSIIERNGSSLQFNNGVRLYDEMRGGNIDGILRLYKQHARQEQAALSCVFRGKVTEGTDLPHELCRSVFVIGIPFSSWKSPVVQGIMDYYDKTISRGRGDMWYMYDAMTAVNQGIGRGIRDPDSDYCKAFLLDNRYIYRKAGIYNKLSDWIRKNVMNDSGSAFDDIKHRTERFFTNIERIRTESA